MQRRIKLSIAPNRISQEEWAKAWSNTLLLAQTAGFLGTGTDAQEGQTYYSCPVEYNTHPPSSGLKLGLYGDIKDYRALCHYNDLGGDLLVDYFSPDRFDPLCLVDIWDNVTVLWPTAFMQLLAIACLLCDRFPDAVILDGNITATQCYRAANWASDLLGVPVRVPVIADPDRLLERVIKENLSLLEAFRCVSAAYIGPRDEEWSDLMKNRFYDLAPLYTK